MINLEEVKETNRVVNAEKGVSALKYERQGIYKYIINEEKGVVVCVFDHGMKRALSELYMDLKIELKFSPFFGVFSKFWNDIIDYDGKWYEFVEEHAKQDIEVLKTNFTVNGVLRAFFYKKYGSLYKVPTFKGIARCALGIDTFDKEIGKKIAQVRLVRAYTIFVNEFIEECIIAQRSFVQKTIKVRSHVFADLYRLEEEVINMLDYDDKEKMIEESAFFEHL